LAFRKIELHSLYSLSIDLIKKNTDAIASRHGIGLALSHYWPKQGKLAKMLPDLT